MPTRGRRVLLVEDDPLVRLAIQEALEDAGPHPVLASNAAEAIAVLEARPDILAVLSDIDMPGLANGLSLAWEIKTRWPNTPVALTSGKAAPASGSLPDGVPFLAKPMPLDAMVGQVQAMVRSMLPEPAEGGVVIPFERRSDEA